MENPWNIQSIYDLQYFNCPVCIFKDPSKQDIINHAYDYHPESIEHLMNINDNSLMDISLPWHINVKKEIKTEEEFFENPVDFDYPMNIDCIPDIENENNYDEEIEDTFMVKQEEIEHVEKIRSIIYKCKICDKIFDRLGNYSLHNKQIHGGQKDQKCEKIRLKVYSCEICNKHFDRLGDLNSHNKQRHGGQKDHKCEKCGKAFFYPFYLKLHIKNAHEGIKDFKCEQCDKTFTASGSLKTHIKVVHEGQKEYKCETCGKMFSHIRDHP